MGLRYVNIDVEIGLNTKSQDHTTFSQFGKSHSHSLPLSPLFFSNIYIEMFEFISESPSFKVLFSYVSVLKGHTGSLEFKTISQPEFVLRCLLYGFSEIRTMINHLVRLSKLHRKSLTQAFSICFSKVSYLNFAKLERVHEAVATQVCHEDVLL